MFGDGSKSGDDTGLLGIRISDGLMQVLHFQHPAGGEIVSRSAVDEAVDVAFERFDVVAFFFDPSHAKADDAVEDDRFWWPLVDKWHEKYHSRLKFWAVRSGRRGTRSRSTCSSRPRSSSSSRPSRSSRTTSRLGPRCTRVATGSGST
jgi:hypothetical protein